MKYLHINKLGEADVLYELASDKPMQEDFKNKVLRFWGKSLWNETEGEFIIRISALDSWAIVSTIPRCLRVPTWQGLFGVRK